MGKIFINTDGINNLKNRLRNFSERIHTLENDIVRSLNQLEWEVSNKETIREQINIARKKASILATKSSQMGNFMERTINDFTSTDLRCAHKQKSLTDILEKVWKGFLVLSSRTYKEVGKIGLQLIASFNKAGLFFLNEPNEIRTAKTSIVNKSIGIKTVAVKPIYHSKINGSLSKRINKIQQIPPFKGVISYNPKNYNKNVEEMQRKLNKLGYKGLDGKPLVLDGKFGGNTLYAVNKFKVNNKLENRGELYGKVDNKSWTTMFLSGAVGVQGLTKKEPNPTPTSKVKPQVTPTVKPKVASKVSFGGAMISQHSAKVLAEILREAGIKKVIVTSTVRSSHDQARIMYNNIIKKGSDYSHNLYASAGDQVVSVYDKLKGSKNKNEIIKAMENKIIEVGPSKVSKHCGDPNKLEVIDIAPNSVANKGAFRKAIKEAMIEGKISKFLEPPKDPAYHIEIPQ